MTTQALSVIVIAAIVIVLLALWYMQKQRREHLRGRFGPEYERAVRETGNVGKAESMLSDRERRVEKEQRLVAS